MNKMFEIDSLGTLRMVLILFVITALFGIFMIWGSVEYVEPRWLGIALPGLGLVVFSLGTAGFVQYKIRTDLVLRMRQAPKKLIKAGKPSHKGGAPKPKWRCKFTCFEKPYSHRPSDPGGCGAEFSVELTDLYYIEKPDPKEGWYSYTLYARCPHCERDVYYKQCPAGNAPPTLPSRDEWLEGKRLEADTIVVRD